MSEYIYIQNSQTHGKIGISQRVFDQLALKAIKNISGVSESGKQLKKNQRARLNRPVMCTIKNGIVHVKIIIDVKKGIDIYTVTSTIQKDVALGLQEVTEQIPFDVSVKVESII